MKEDIDAALTVLRNGGVILYPTDTVWGIGCDATNREAVERIRKLKQRNDTKGFLVLLAEPGLIPSYIVDVPDIAWDLLEVSVKPTTLIFDKAKNVAPNLVTPDGSLGIRITKEEFTSRLLQRFRKPLVSTSANICGKPFPKSFDEIPTEIIEGVDYVVKYRQEEKTNPSPSSIIKLGSGGLIQIIRE
jgi:L-threonylcarbamoyladenylate synthase